MQAPISSRVDTMMAGGLMLSIGTLGMTLWLAVLDAHTVTTPPVRPPTSVHLTSSLPTWTLRPLARTTLR